MTPEFFETALKNYLPRRTAEETTFEDLCVERIERLTAANKELDIVVRAERQQHELALENLRFDRSQLHQRISELEAANKELEQQLARRDERQFPIHDGPSIPWRVIQPHERQARENHNQTLQRLAERGGLGIQEAFYVLTDSRWTRPFIPREEALARVREIVDAESYDKKRIAELEQRYVENHQAWQEGQQQWATQVAELEQSLKEKDARIAAESKLTDDAIAEAKRQCEQKLRLSAMKIASVPCVTVNYRPSNRTTAWLWMRS